MTNEEVQSVIEAVEESPLTKKIKELEWWVAELERKLEKATTLETLGALRLRGAVLLYIGTDSATDFLERIREEYGEDVYKQTEHHLFELNNAPVSEEHREALRSAFNHGYCRF